MAKYFTVAIAENGTEQKRIDDMMAEDFFDLDEALPPRLKAAVKRKAWRLVDQLEREYHEKSKSIASYKRGSLYSELYDAFAKAAWRLRVLLSEENWAALREDVAGFNTGRLVRQQTRTRLDTPAMSSRRKPVTGSKGTVIYY